MNNESKEIFAKNLDFYMNRKGVDRNKLCADLDLKYTTVRDWLKGITYPRIGKIELLADYFGINKSDLIENKLTPTQAPDELKTRLIENYTTLNTERRQRLVRASSDLVKEQEHADISEPLVAYHVVERLSAGLGQGVYDDYDTVYHTEDLPYDLASWIAGDSMEPDYLDGHVALIKDTSGTLDYQGAICAVVWDGKTYIKKVYQEETGFRLVSINPKYADLFAAYDEEPRIVGKIVGSFKPVEG